MEYIYASLLLHYAKKPIEEDNIRKVLKAAGMDVDDVRLKAIVAALKEVNIDEAISAASIVTPTVSVTAAPTVEAKEKEEKGKKEEEKKEEEEVAEGLASLFG
ncbi:MAG: 50S ribosomal protein P1 [Candidatus Methanomethylicia archaeon]